MTNDKIKLGAFGKIRDVIFRDERRSQGWRQVVSIGPKVVVRSGHRQVSLHSWAFFGGEQDAPTLFSRLTFSHFLQ